MTLPVGGPVRPARSSAPSTVGARAPHSGAGMPAAAPPAVAAAPRYLAWRVADLAAFPNANERQGSKAREGEPYILGSAGGIHVYEKAACGVCGELVWVQTVNVDGREIVCWPCAGAPVPAPPAAADRVTGVAGDIGPSAPRLSPALGSVLATIRDLRASDRERLADLRDEHTRGDLEGWS